MVLLNSLSECMTGCLYLFSAFLIPSCYFLLICSHNKGGSGMKNLSNEYLIKFMHACMHIHKYVKAVLLNIQAHNDVLFKCLCCVLEFSQA